MTLIFVLRLIRYQIILKYLIYVISAEYSKGYALTGLKSFKSEIIANFYTCRDCELESIKRQSIPTKTHKVIKMILKKTDEI